MGINNFYSIYLYLYSILVLDKNIYNLNILITNREEGEVSPDMGKEKKPPFSWLIS